MLHVTKCLGRIRGVEHRGAGDDPIDARPGYFGNVVETYSAVDFDAEIEVAFGPPADEFADFDEGTRNEVLAAVTRIHAHDQDVIDDVEHIFQQEGAGSGIDNNTRLGAVILDHMERAVEVAAHFVVHTDTVGARLDEDGRIGIGVLDHQMMVKLEIFERTPDGFGDGGPHGEVGDEVAVHDVDVNHAGAGLLDGLDLFAQTRKVSRENGWDDLNHNYSAEPKRTALPRVCRSL